MVYVSKCGSPGFQIQQMITRNGHCNRYPIGYWTVFCYTVENRGGEIRMKKEKAKRYYLTKMLTSYILIVFILLICAFSSFFYFTIRTKTAEIEKSSQKAMEQIGFTAKILYDQVSQVGAGAFKRAVRGEILFPFRFGTGFRIQPLQ